MRTRLAFALGLVACDVPNPDGDQASDARAVAPDPVAEALAPVRARERGLVGQRRPPWSSVSGPDPLDVVAWDGGFIGLLRGASAIVRLGAHGQELARIDAPAGASGWARDGDRIAVVGERSGELYVVAIDGPGLRLERRVAIEGIAGLRAVAVRPGDKGWVVADRHRGRVLWLDASGRIERQSRCEGAIDVVVHERWSVAVCLLEHRVRVFEAGKQVAAVTHDGPIWAVAPRTVEGGLELGLTGVEDHPLERRDGSFGFIDSFVFRVRLLEGELRRLDAVNVAAHGVVTPKALAWRGETLWVTGAGGEAVAEIDFADEAKVRTHAAPAGLVGFDWSGEAMLAADPLLDAWVRVSPGGSWSLVDVPGGGARPDLVAIGEALVFTTLAAPAATSEGRASRFTCETCHFEGTVDGRVHYTGRGEVHASTKTLRGLVGNHPHFSRALDPSTTDMVHNEFRVANAGTGQDPWFTLEVASVPWLSAVTARPRLDPATLRVAMVEFLAAFTPEPNPAVGSRRRFDDLERRGADRFAALCEDCHQARTVADDPTTRRSRARWEASVFEGGRLLWASDRRYRTGVQPYVHEEGPRVPSLRRLWVKRPYLTQGTADDLQAVLEAFRVGVPTVHAGSDGTPLSEDDRACLAAFLDLL